MRTKGARNKNQQSLYKRFWNKVAIVLDKTSCWNWQASINRVTGYGGFKLPGGLLTERPHRVCAIYFKSGVRSLCRSDYVCHTCDNKLCVRPSHLVIADGLWNARDRESKGRGKHPLADLNPSRKLSSGDIPHIHELKAQGKSYSSIAALFGVSNSTIRQIVIGKTWRSIK